MPPTDKSEAIVLITTFLYIFTFSLLGAIIKDTYNTIIDREYKINLSKIFISTIVSSIILMAFSEKILEIISIRMLIFPCFIGGMIGFELLDKIKDLEYWVGVYKQNRR